MEKIFKGRANLFNLFRKSYHEFDLIDDMHKSFTTCRLISLTAIETCRGLSLV
jgi:hypothetical protein